MMDIENMHPFCLPFGFCHDATSSTAMIISSDNNNDQTDSIKTTGSTTSSSSSSSSTTTGNSINNNNNNNNNKNEMKASRSKSSSPNEELLIKHLNSTSTTNINNNNNVSSILNDDDLIISSSLLDHNVGSFYSLELNIDDLDDEDDSDNNKDGRGIITGNGIDSTSPFQDEDDDEDIDLIKGHHNQHLYHHLHHLNDVSDWYCSQYNSLFSPLNNSTNTSILPQSCSIRNALLSSSSSSSTTTTNHHHHHHNNNQYHLHHHHSSVFHSHGIEPIDIKSSPTLAQLNLNSNDDPTDEGLWDTAASCLAVSNNRHNINNNNNNINRSSRLSLIVNGPSNCSSSLAINVTGSGGGALSSSSSSCLTEANINSSSSSSTSSSDLLVSNRTSILNQHHLNHNNNNQLNATNNHHSNNNNNNNNINTNINSSNQQQLNDKICNHNTHNQNSLSSHYASAHLSNSISNHHQHHSMSCHHINKHGIHHHHHHHHQDSEQASTCLAVTPFRKYLNQYQYSTCCHNVNNNNNNDNNLLATTMSQNKSNNNSNLKSTNSLLIINDTDNNNLPAQNSNSSSAQQASFASNNNNQQQNFNHQQRSGSPALVSSSSSPLTSSTTSLQATLNVNSNNNNNNNVGENKLKENLEYLTSLFCNGTNNNHNNQNTSQNNHHHQQQQQNQQLPIHQATATSNIATSTMARSYTTLAQTLSREPKLLSDRCTINNNQAQHSVNAQVINNNNNNNNNDNSNSNRILSSSSSVESQQLHANTTISSLNSSFGTTQAGQYNSLNSITNEAVPCGLPPGALTSSGAPVGLEQQQQQQLSSSVSCLPLPGCPIKRPYSNQNNGAATAAASGALAMDWQGYKTIGVESSVSAADSTASSNSDNSNQLVSTNQQLQSQRTGPSDLKVLSSLLTANNTNNNNYPSSLSSPMGASNNSGQQDQFWQQKSFQQTVPPSMIVPTETPPNGKPITLMPIVTNLINKTSSAPNNNGNTFSQLGAPLEKKAKLFAQSNSPSGSSSSLELSNLSLPNSSPSALTTSASSSSAGLSLSRDKKNNKTTGNNSPSTKIILKQQQQQSITTHDISLASPGSRDENFSTSNQIGGDNNNNDNNNNNNNNNSSDMDDDDSSDDSDDESFYGDYTNSDLIGASISDNAENKWTLNMGRTRRNGQKRYFWQYNVQSKGPKGTRICSTDDSEDPFVLPEASDPVFSNDCQIEGVKHSGKARRGDGNDLTPNPKKLLMIGLELKKLGKIINDLAPVTDLPINARNKTRKEKNKLASRACRLKKKAQHEANKIKLYGLQREHQQVVMAIYDIRKLLNKTLLEREQNLTIENNRTATNLASNNNNNKNDSLINVNSSVKTIAEQCLMTVAGLTSDYVNSVLEKVVSGCIDGGLQTN